MKAVSIIRMNDRFDQVVGPPDPRRSPKPKRRAVQVARVFLAGAIALGLIGGALSGGLGMGLLGYYFHRWGKL